MPFPGDLTLIDAFDRADGTAHAGAGSTIWQDLTLGGGSSTLIISSNALATTTTGAGGVTVESVADFIKVWTATISRDHAYFFRIQNPSSGSWEAYWFLVLGGSWQLHKRVAGVSSQIAVTSANSLNDGEKVGVRAYGDLLEVYRTSAGAWEQVLSVTDTSIPGAGYGYFELESTQARIDDLSSADPSLAVPTAPVTMYVDADHAAASDAYNRTTAADPATPFFSIQKACSVAYATPDWADTILVKPASAADPTNIDPRMYKAIDHKYMRTTEYPTGLQFGDNSGNVPITVIGDSFNDGEKAILDRVYGRRLKNWVFEGFQQGHDVGSGRDNTWLGSLQSVEDLVFRRFHWTGGGFGVDAWSGTAADGKVGLLIEDCEINAPLGPPGTIHSGEGFGISSDPGFNGAVISYGDVTFRRCLFDGVRGDDAIRIGMIADAVNTDGTLTVEDCLFHDVTESGPGGNEDFHTDSIQVLGVPKTYVRRNVFIGCSDAIMASDFHNGLIVAENNLMFASGGLIQMQGTDEFVCRHNTILAQTGSTGEDATIIFFTRYALAQPMKVTMVNNIIGGIRNASNVTYRTGSVIANNIEIAHPGRGYGFGTNISRLPEFGTSARMDDLPTDTIGGWGTVPTNYELANTPVVSPGIGQGQVTDIATDRLGRAYASPPDIGCHQSDSGTAVLAVARAPYVVSRFPASGAIGVSATVSAEAVLYPKPGNEIAPATVTAGTARVSDSRGQDIPAVVTLAGIDADGQQSITIDMKTSLSPLTEGSLYPLETYTVRLSSDIEDTEGSAFLGTSWTFKVIGPVGPAIYSPGDSPASITLAPDVRFPPGTILQVFDASSLAGPVTPIGVNSAVVASNSTVTFSGLGTGRYVAGVTSAGPFVAFNVYDT